jgi:hypothetical protein
MFFGLNDVAFLAAVSAPAIVLDPDAAAYIAAVEAADTQALEPAVRTAINDFVVGCKADGIWAAIKASCILAGARTLTGALVPLVGAAPTNVGGLFVSGDYDRKTGLVGDGSTKYLDSNRNNNADPQNSKHISVFASTAATSGGGQFPAYIGAGGSNSGAIQLGRAQNNGGLYSRINSSTFTAASGPGASTEFIGANRSNSGGHDVRAAGNTVNYTAASQAPFNGNINVFWESGTVAFSNARLAFYSIGESLDLALLDARVTDLINAFDAAI